MPSQTWVQLDACEATTESAELQRIAEFLLATPAGARIVYETVLAHTIYCCEFGVDGEPRSTQGTRQALLAEANRFERGRGWLRGNPPLEKLMADDLRRVATSLPQRPPGRPQVSNPARPLLDRVIIELRSELQKSGREDKAARILDPGKQPGPGQRGGAASGISTAVGILIGLNERHGWQLTEAEIWAAADDIRRAERRKRK